MLYFWLGKLRLGAKKTTLVSSISILYVVTSNEDQDRSQMQKQQKTGISKQQNNIQYNVNNLLTKEKIITLII